MIMRACLGYPGYRCGELIPANRRRSPACERRNNAARAASRPTGELSFYSSAAWKKLRAEVLREADGCAWCRKRGVKLTADHVQTIRRRPYLALEPDNVVAACRSCQVKRQYGPMGGRGDG